MAVLTPSLIIGREPCPRLHPCRSLPSPTRWAGWSYPIRSRSPRACERCWLGWSIRASAAGSATAWSCVLTAAVCAVAAGARSFVAVAEWVADLPDAVGSRSGDRAAVSVGVDDPPAVLGRSTPTGSTPRSAGSCSDCAPAVAPVGRRRVLAVDGKTLRGSRHAGRDGERGGGRHLLAVIDQHTRVVLGQIDVDGKTNEITAFTPAARHPDRHRPDRRGDHRGRVAHPTRARRRPARPRRALGADREGQPAPAAPPARRAALAAGRRRRIAAPRPRHGRREIRTLKVVTIAAGIEFPHAAQAIQITRRTRPVTARTGQDGPVAHRDRLRDHRPGPAPGPTRRAGRLDPRALADRERPALGP